MNKKLLALLLALLAIVGLAAGCGDDDEDEAADDTTEEVAADEEATDEEAAEDGSELAEGEIDPAVVEEFIAAFIDDPTILCDPANATEEMIESFGGEELCLESAATEEAGQEYQINDLQVEGDTATAELENATGTTTISFVQEGDQLKVSGIEGGGQ